MTWLRIDDKFVRHPKIASLDDHAFRVWVGVLCYCAEYKTGGVVPDPSYGVVTGLSQELVEGYVQAGLLARVNQHRTQVHDWEVYNPADPTAAERMRRWRAKNDRHDDRNADRNDDVTETVSRAQARARGADPSRPVEENPHPSEGFSSSNRSDETDDATPPSPNGAASLSKLNNLTAYVNRVWDDYPNKTVLLDELVDRGLTSDQAASIIAAGDEAHA